MGSAEVGAEGLSAPGELSPEEADNLIIEHRDWAERIARSVARAWNMDWEADGLRSAALEALMFCARRFQPSRGVPFRGYARKRIHEAASEEARRSKRWQAGMQAEGTEERARNLSARVLDAFPEMREGKVLLDGSESEENATRETIRRMLVSATLAAISAEHERGTLDEALDLKKLVKFLSALEPIHQLLLWKVYWEGLSLRSVASAWSTDELNVVREHTALLTFLQRCLELGKPINTPKIRPALRAIALQVKRESPQGAFGVLLRGGG